jgi:hypothetical protein
MVISSSLHVYHLDRCLEGCEAGCSDVHDRPFVVDCLILGYGGWGVACAWQGEICSSLSEDGVLIGGVRFEASSYFVR